jgi:ABC-type glycerol-3-phosphate transport system substrate-binding protein
MKKIIMILIAVMALLGTALGQTTTTTPKTKQGQISAQSTSVDVSSTSLNFLYLRDGFDNYAAFSLPLYTFANTQGRFKLNTIGAFDPNDIKRQAYMGLGVSYDVVNTAGYKLTLFGGMKGLNLSDNFRLQDGDRGYVFGLGVSIPFGK